MGVQNLSLSIGPDYTVEGRKDGILVHENMDASYGERDIRLVWSTEFGTEWQKEWCFTVEAECWGWQNYGNYVQAKTKVGTYNATIPATQCNMTKPDGDNGRVWWSHNLAIGQLLSAINNGHSTWKYAWRACDSCELHVTMWSHFQDGMEWNGMHGSDVATLNVSIGFCPEYRLQQLRMTKDYLEIEYETTWKRFDDRFWFAWNQSEGGELPCVVFFSDWQRYEKLLNSEYTGTIPSIGLLRVPVEKLARIPIGQLTHINVAFNASYRPVSMEFARMVGQMYPTNATVCSDINLTLKQNADGRIVLGTSNKYNAQTPAEEAVVTMNGYGDTVTVPIGEDAVFDYPPFGVFLSFSGYGQTDEGATSENVTTLMNIETAVYDKVVIDGTVMDDRIEVEWVPTGTGKALQIQSSRDYDTVKLAGRQRPTAGFATGGAKTVKFSSVVFGTAEEYEDMLDFNDTIMVRFPDGRRYNLAASIKMSKVTDSVMGGMWTIDITGEEVEVS